MKKKLIVFHNSLAPYRIDFFNELNNAFDAEFYFFRKNLVSQKFNTKKLIEQLNFDPHFMTKGFDLYHKERMIRFGYLKKIAQVKPDVIICLEYSYITFSIALFAKVFLPKTKVYSICDDSVAVAQNSSMLRKLGRSLSLMVLDGLILGNDFAKDWYKENFPNVDTVVNPIIQKEERIQGFLDKTDHITKAYSDKYNLKGKNILLFVGRLVKVKNLNTLLNVFSTYLTTNKNSVLILVGDGCLKKELTGLVESLKIEDNVIFAGRYENEALYAWYRLADYFILPSISEVFGAVVNESLIAGVPVMCSDVAGAACLINKENGVIFDPYDEEKMLSMLSEKLNGNVKEMKGLSNSVSLMPYTFNQKIRDVISFLRKDI